MGKAEVKGGFERIATPDDVRAELRMLCSSADGFVRKQRDEAPEGGEPLWMFRLMVVGLSCIRSLG